MLLPLLWRRAWTHRSAYAKGKLARELREILADLSKAERSPANLSLLEGVEL